MFDKLFKKGDKEKASAGKVKGSKPRDLHAAIGREMIVTYKNDPDWVWQLKQVQKPSEQEPKMFEFRVYDPLAATNKGIIVRDYFSLDDYPNLILYHGWVNLKNNDAHVAAGADIAIQSDQQPL